MSSGSIREHGRARRSAPTSGRTSPTRRWLAGLVVVVLAVIGLAAGTDAVRALVPAGQESPFDGPLAGCRVDDRLTPQRAPGDWARTLLDQEYALAADDVPSDLVALADRGIGGGGYLRSLVMDDLAAMDEDARETGSAFRITSAFRSYEDQVRTFASLEAAFGRDEALRSAARPGHSEHQLGTTIDIGR